MSRSGRFVLSARANVAAWMSPDGSPAIRRMRVIGAGTQREWTWICFWISRTISRASRPCSPLTRGVFPSLTHWMKWRSSASNGSCLATRGLEMETSSIDSTRGFFFLKILRLFSE